MKSAIRVLACSLALTSGDVKVLAFMFICAEALGVVEELFDKRGVED